VPGSAPLADAVPPPPPPPPTQQQEHDQQWEELLKETNDLLAAVENNIYDLPDPSALTSPAAPATAPIPSPLPPSSTATTPPHPTPLLLLLQIILSSFRHTTRPSSKIVGMHLITRLAHFTDDETRLQRLVPYVATFERSDIRAGRHSSGASAAR
jgi:hypothetical protein